LDLERNGNLLMRRIAAFVLLAALSAAWPIRAKAQSPGVVEYERESKAAYKKQQKAAKKAAKKQFKLVQKAQKKQAKAYKKAQKEQQKHELKF
jgi:peptide subunit release factor RF-3